ncbi:hypothetical protein BDY19DRAFT_101113 [Irpex rosettiformis]|uniref:Uncharacterized protein n=1 Tax=Irpex rosettiformis TaxID=378272 RepID=A0ACB8TM31_9APHY|nr:hypothetical protein BDY19DRAFT_101113 [Irpex rosettiformis]
MLSRSPDDPDLTMACRALSSKLEKITDKLGPIKGLPTDRALWNQCVRFIKAPVNANVIQDCITMVDKALSDYQLSMTQRIFGIVWAQMKSNEQSALSKLKHSGQASFSGEDRPQCLKDTREEVLDSLRTWALSESGEQFFWLNGPAGSGKSTIAQTFAYWLHSKGKLGASFFCSRNADERRDLKMIFPTIAFQLATSANVTSPRFRDVLLPVLQVDHDSSSLSLRNQLQDLILRPATVSGMKTIVVIDALDECTDDSTTSTLLSLLTDVAANMQSIQFFITSRPESSIRVSFHRKDLNLRSDKQSLSDVPTALVTHDIGLFLKAGLARLASNRPHLRLDQENWPSEEVVDALARKSAGLFIFASTVLKFVDDTHYDPREQLKKILSNTDDSTIEGSEGLDKLYMDILVNAVPKRDDQFSQRLLATLGLLIVAYEPLSSTVIAGLLGFERDTDVLTILDTLHSLILIPNDLNTPLRFHHKSFPDFMTDITRCTDSRFQVNQDGHHFSTSRACLAYLVKTIHSAPRYTLKPDISPGCKAFLTYSCQYWGRHLLTAERSQVQDKPGLIADEREELEVQVSKQMDLLVLLGELVGRAVVELPGDYPEWINNSWFFEQDDTLLEWIEGKQKFILFDVKKILQRVLSEYDSQPVPSLSVSIGRLARSMIIDDSFATTRARVIIGAVSAMEMPNEAYAVEYSHDGLRLAIGGENFVQLISPITGERMNGPRINRSGIVHSLAFSHDDKILAIAINNCIMVWNVTEDTTYVQAKELHGQPSGPDVMKVAFYCAPDPTGKHDLLSIDDVGHVRLWGISNSYSCCELEFTVDDASKCGAACWMPEQRTGEDLKAIAVGSRLGHVELRNITATGSSLRKTLKFPSVPDIFQPKSVDAVAISRDGTLIAAGSDNGVIIYYAETGAVYHFEDLSKVSPPMFSLAFSPQEGPPVVAFTCNNTAGLLSKESDFRQLHSHGMNRVGSVAFSPNDNSIASVSRDLIIGIATEIEHHHCHASRVNCAHFSLDGRFVVSASDDGIVRVWDATNGALLQTLVGHSSRVIDAIFLSDDMYVLSSDAKGELILWDRHSRQVLYRNTGISSKSTRNFPFTDGNLGFFVYQPDSNRIDCYRIRRKHSEGAQLRLMAQLSLPVKNRLDRVVRIRQETDSKAQNVVVAQLESGKRFTVPWTYSDKKFTIPKNLTFQEQPVTETRSWNLGGHDSSIGDEEYCYRDVTSAWILDRRSQRVVWVPPIHRGHCRWRKGKLLIQGENGRLTLADFSEAAMAEA